MADDTVGLNIRLQDLELGDMVDFQVVVATAVAEAMPATVHNDQEFYVIGKARNV